MNTYLLVILASLILGTGWTLYLEWLNLKSLAPTAPPLLADIHDPLTYKKSQDYARAKGKLEMTAQFVSAIATLVFILAGGFPFFDSLARFSQNEIATGLTFFVLLFATTEILGLPFSLYISY